MLIISLSSIPPRFPKIGETLGCLLNQTVKADRILLHIPQSYRRFPDWDGTLPQVPDGVDVVRVDKDYGPATKVLPAARAFRGQDVDILFCDDDRIYPRDWAAVFVAARRDHPDACIATVAREASELFPSAQIRDHHPRAIQRAWITDIPFLLRYGVFEVKNRIWGGAEKPSRKVVGTPGYTDLFMGLGGVMVRPEHFDDVAYDIPGSHWMVDDIWLSGMLARGGVPIWTPADVMQPNLARAHFESGLVDSQIGGLDRDTADRACYDYLRETYGIWP